MYIEAVENKLISEGVDKSLFKMPAIQERLLQIYIFNMDDIKLKEDGTFSVKEFDISRVKSENQKQKGYVFKINKKIKNGELITYINEQGIEMESIELISDHVQTTKIRKDGLITIAEGDKQQEFFDNGNWDLDNKGIFNENGNISFDNDSGLFTKAINSFKQNERKLVQKYPHLKEWEDAEKKAMIKAFNNKTNEEVDNLRKENERLKENNERLEKMLEKSLLFAQTVRDSAVGKLFFAKKANEIFGENEENVKILSDDNER